jgi:DNA-binding response OmpR family regulator
MSPELRIILVVEDDAPLRAMYRTALRMAGFYVNEASNGLEALRALDADPPDLVVLDLGLPIVSGYGVRTEIAAQSQTRNIPVVVVTGTEPQAPLDVPCLLRKPVSPETLVAAVNKCFADGKSAARGVS